MREKIRITKTLERGWCVIWPAYGFGYHEHVQPRASFKECIDTVSQRKIVDSHSGGQVTADQWSLRDAYVGNRSRPRLDIH